MSGRSSAWSSRSDRGRQTTDWWWLHSGPDAKSVPAGLTPADTGGDSPDGGAGAL